jgi:hypothetical protein
MNTNNRIRTKHALIYSYNKCTCFSPNSSLFTYFIKKRCDVITSVTRYSRQHKTQPNASKFGFTVTETTGLMWMENTNIAVHEGNDVIVVVVVEMTNSMH